MNLSVHPAHFQQDTPPLLWTNEDNESAFTAYLENVSVGNTEARDWTLFSLAITALQARAVSDFEEMFCLEHVQGFIPLPHQVKTAERVLRDLHGRAILADEVGLGKTIEAGLIMKEYLLRGLVKKILILVPASLVLQWARELNEKFRISAMAQRNEWTWEQYDIVVASLDTAKREPHRSRILNEPWDLLVIDEAHKLKNNKTRNWQMVNEIPNKYMLLLTATPMQNQLKELHTLITLLKPGQLGTTQEFATQYVESARIAKSTPELKNTLSDVMIRNRRSEGGTQLPKRHVRVVPLELSAPERLFYDNVQQFLRDEYHTRKANRISILPLLTVQREICSSPYAAMVTLEKMKKSSKSERFASAVASLIETAEQIRVYTKVETVLNMLEEINDKCIIFTEYRATQDFLLFMLKKRGIAAVPFRGGFKRGKKDWMKDLFAHKMQVLVATESGGEGINLQFCNHMINFDLPWNPMRLEQRIGRIHRLGQENEVYVYNFSTRNTIEAHIVELLHEKIKMFESVIGELDYIVGGKEIDKLDECVLDWAMSGESDEMLRKKLKIYSENILHHIHKKKKVSK